jgi:hypothetical protein
VKDSGFKKHKYKTMKKILFLIVLTTGYLKNDAQLISKEVINKYSPGAIRMLYDIAKTIKLTEAQQINLAELFEITDALLVKDLKEGKTPGEIDSAQHFAQLKISMIIGPDMIAYSAKKADGFANAASGGETKYMQQAYNLDTGLAAKMRVLQFNKYKKMYQQFLLYEFNGTIAEKKIAEASKRFDSLAFTMYPTLHSGKYLDSYLADVKKIKPSIPDSIIRKIQNAFFAFTMKNVYIDCGQTMLDIMQHIYPDTAITAHFYKPVIERQAKFLSSAERYYLINEQHISKSAFDSVYGLVWQKNYQQALLEYTHGANSTWRDSLIAISNKHYDYLIRAALLRDGSLISTSQFAIALKYKTALQLRPTLTDTLLWHAMYLDNKQDSVKAKNHFAKTDFKAYEAKWLNVLLSDEQYTKLLAIKNASTARLDAEDDWEDMQTWNITTGFDKEATLKELNNYYMAKWIAYYRLAHDKLKQEANQRAIKDMQPKALKMLGAAKKLPNPVNDNTNLQLKW